MADDSLAAELARVCGAENVLTGDAIGAEYNRDFLGVCEGRARAVVLPQNEKEVCAAARVCFQKRAPMVARGGGTGYAGAATPDAGGRAVVFAMRRMRKVTAVDFANRTITAEAGCVLETMQNAAAEKDLLFPLTLGAKGICQIGGNLATNAGGTNVLRYGDCRSLCLGLRAVLADGSAVGSLSGLRKDNSGYDIKQLFIGSEGTLGIITAAVFQLFSPPKARGCAFAALESPRRAAEFFHYCRGVLGESLTAFELMPRLLFSLLAKHLPQLRAPFAQTPPYAALFEFACESEKEAKEKTELLLAAALEKGMIADAVPAQTESARADFWLLRESAPEATKREGKWIKADVSLPLSHLPEFLEQTERELPALSPGKYITAFGHWGDGNMHISAMPENPAAAEKISEAVYDAVAKFGGSFSAEHGIGQKKITLLQKYKSPEELAAMRAVKNALDPHNLMNPGKVLAEKPQTEKENTK